MQVYNVHCTVYSIEVTIYQALYGIVTALIVCICVQYGGYNILEDGDLEEIQSTETDDDSDSQDDAAVGKKVTYSISLP